jgi:uncharacterized membrane protein YhhN
MRYPTLFWIALVAFALISAANLYLQTEHTPRALKIRHLTKALLMPTLMALVIAYQLNTLIVVALFFSFLGDVFLIKHSNTDFLLGLTSFLTAHIFYSIYFFSLIDFSTLPLSLWGLALVIFWYGLILFKGVNPKGTVRYGMPIYMLAIGCMLFFAMLHFYQKTGLASSFLLLGALLFSSSDSVLAFRRIKKVTILPNSYVMFSYISGQFLIVLSTFVL